MSEAGSLDSDAVGVEESLRGRARNDALCFPSKTERPTMKRTLELVDVPVPDMHMRHGQRTSAIGLDPFAKAEPVRLS